MKESKVKIALEYIRDRIHEAWEKGEKEVDIRLGDVHKQLGWKNNQHTVGEAMFRLFSVFNYDEEIYPCSCKIIRFPVWRSSLENLYGMNLTMRFCLCELEDEVFHNILFMEYNKKIKKFDEECATRDRAFFEIDNLYELLKQKNFENNAENCHEHFQKFEYLTKFIKKHSINGGHHEQG